MAEIRALKRFKEVIKERHGYARDWKNKTGGRVAGYLCTYVPEELIYASGQLPVRIMGSHEPQDVSEQHIFGQYCPFSRDCLAQGLKGQYNYLDTIVNAASCMHMRQAFESWRRHVLPRAHFIVMPAQVQSRHAREYLTHEFQTFKDFLEKDSGQVISEEKLAGAIQIYNKNRQLTRKIYELRRSVPPLISGAEAMDVVLSSAVMDKEEHNTLLEDALQELPGHQGRIKPGVRLMVLGSEDDDREFLELAESTGANIVIDDHCTGTRYFWNEVSLNGDLVSSLAARYLDKPPCAQKDLVKRRRFEHILNLVEEYKVQGAIQIVQKFCDTHQWDLQPIKALLNEKGIPSLLLEFDMTVAAGQFRTRLEAFLEVVDTGDSFV